jgi:curved DNA-binding protein CbpA
MMDDYYSILEVSPSASLQEIKESYRFLVQANHPDKFGSEKHKKRAEERIKRINEAYEILSDSDQRVKYDRNRSTQSSQTEEKQRQRDKTEAEQQQRQERQRREQAEKAQAEEEHRKEEEKQRKSEEEVTRRHVEEEQQIREQAEKVKVASANRHKTAILAFMIGSGVVALMALPNVQRWSIILTTNPNLTRSAVKAANNVEDAIASHTEQNYDKELSSYKKPVEQSDAEIQNNLEKTYDEQQDVVQNDQKSPGWYVGAEAESHLRKEENASSIGEKSQKKICDSKTDEIFFSRHPELNYRKLSKSETEFIFEWNKILANLPNCQKLTVNLIEKTDEYTNDLSKADTSVPNGFEKLVTKNIKPESSLPIRIDELKDAETAYSNQDYEKAFLLYTELAEKGDTNAQLNLGEMYYKGRGISQDIVQAHMWFTLATTNEDDKAHRFLNELTQKMTLAQEEEAQRMARNWRLKKQN